MIVTIQAWQGNTPACNLYGEKLGFETIGTKTYPDFKPTPDFEGEWVDNVYFSTVRDLVMQMSHLASEVNDEEDARYAVHELKKYAGQLIKICEEAKDYLAKSDVKSAKAKLQDYDNIAGAAYNFRGTAIILQRVAYGYEVTHWRVHLGQDLFQNAFMAVALYIQHATENIEQGKISEAIGFIDKAVSRLDKFNHGCDAFFETCRKIKIAIIDWDETVSLAAAGYQAVTLPRLVSIIMGIELTEEEQKRLIENAAKEGWVRRTTTAIEQLIAQGRLDAGLVELTRQFMESHGGSTAVELVTWAVVQAERMGRRFTEREKFIQETAAIASWNVDSLDNPESLKSLRLKMGLEEISVRGAVDFIKYMHRLGIKVYVVSSGLEQAVRAEVKIFGLDEYIADVKGDTGAAGVNKDILIPQIIARHKDAIRHPGEVLIVGDGHREIGVGKRLNATTIGVAAGHKTGFGEKLKEAGAQYIVENFGNTRLLSGIVGLSFRPLATLQGAGLQVVEHRELQSCV